MKKRHFSIGGRYYVLPEVLRFGLRDYAYEPVAVRKPRRGECFVSGAIPEIYKAPNDLSAEYLIVSCLSPTKPETIYRKVNP